MKRRVLLIGFSIFSMAVVQPGWAQRNGPDVETLFAQADTNHDGKVSREEFMTARAARFDKLDRNHDGYLSMDDIPHFMQSNTQMMQKFQAMVTMADTNHDGKVSRDEFIAVGVKMFDFVDVNHDGFIDQAEMQQAVARLRAMAPQ